LIDDTRFVLDVDSKAAFCTFGNPPTVVVSDNQLRRRFLEARGKAFELTREFLAGLERWRFRDFAAFLRARLGHVILIGHAHFDHMSDVASVAIRTARLSRACVFRHRYQLGGPVGATKTEMETEPRQEPHGRQ
jgi:glyoxylase-like metal-dependent hydrolase (beta-lactamase superfamily II)